jgi:hypothetical protein
MPIYLPVYLSQTLCSLSLSLSVLHCPFSLTLPRSLSHLLSLSLHQSLSFPLTLSISLSLPLYVGIDLKTHHAAAVLIL